MSERQRYPRSGCCVPFCRRTSTLFRDEWICGEHWRLVDRDLKRLRTRLLIRFKRRPQTMAVRRAWLRIEQATWRRMKRQAIERATGISA